MKASGSSLKTCSTIVIKGQIISALVVHFLLTLFFICLFFVCLCVCVCVCMLCRNVSDPSENLMKAMDPFPRLCLPITGHTVSECQGGSEAQAKIPRCPFPPYYNIMRKRETYSLL